MSINDMRNVRNVGILTPRCEAKARGSEDELEQDYILQRVRIRDIVKRAEAEGAVMNRGKNNERRKVKGRKVRE